MGRGIAFRRWRKWAVVLAVFAIGIPVSAALTIRSSEAHTRLRALLIDTIRQELGMSASLGPVQLQLSPFAIVARDVSLADPVYGRVADASRIAVRPSVGALLRGQVDLDAIELDGASVHLVIRDGQLRNLPRIEGGGGGGEMTLPFGELVIREASLTVDADPIASGALHVDEITVRGERGGVIDVTVVEGTGSITREGTEHALERLEGHVEIASDALRVQQLALALGPLHAEIGEGYVPLPPPDPRTEGARGYVGQIAVDYELEHLATLGLPITLPAMWGHAAIRARLSHDGAHGQRATGSVRLDHGRITEFGIGDVAQIEFEATPREVRITSGEVQVVGGGGTLTLGGTLGLTEELPLDVTAELHAFSFAHLMDQLSVSQNSIVEWIFEGSMVLRGSLRDLDLSGPVDLRTHDFTVSANAYHERPLRTVIAIPRGHFRGEWSIRNDAIRFTDLVADLPHSRLYADVLLGFRNELRVSARADPADLRDVSPLTRFQLAGIGTATCEIDGFYQAPRVTGHVRIQDFVFDSFRLGDVDSDAVLDSDGMGVTFPHIVAVKDDSRYAANDVYLDFHRNAFRMSGRLALERMELADFYHVFGFEADERFTPYQGVAHGEAEIDYTNGYPGDSPSGTLDVGMRLALSDMSVDDYQFERGALEGRFRWLDWSRGISGAELLIDHASLHKGEGTVSLQGTMAVGGALRMTAAADALALRELEGIGDRFPGLDGIATATAQVGGTPDAMRIDLDVGLTNVVYAGRAIGDARAYVRQTHQDDAWIQDALAWEGQPPEHEDCPLARMGLARANWPNDPPLRTVDGLQPRLSRASAFVICGTALDGRMTVDLAVGRTQQYPLRGRIALDGLELAAFMPVPSPGAPASRGKVSAELVLEDGGLRDLSTLAGRLEVSDLELARGDVAFTNRGPLLFSLKNGVASVDRARLVGPDSRIRVRGQYALPVPGDDGGLALQMDARVDLGLLARITPAVTEADGDIVARLAISGPISDPEIYGDARLEGGSLRAAALPTPVEGLDAHVTFSARSIQIDELRAHLAGGTIRGNGEAQLADGRLSRWNVRVHGEGLELAPADGMDLALAADVEVGWTRGERLPTARGELRVGRLAFTRNIDLGTTLGELSRTQRAEVQRYDPDADRVALDLRIVDEQPFVVRNNLVEAELVIDDTQRAFRIVGTDQRYGVLGSMQFTRGRIFFRNAIFDVRNGSLSFDDDTRIDPTFTLGAVTEVRRSGDLAAARWRILLDARGSMGSFEIQTSSDPDLPQEDILMLLAVGMTRGEFEQLQTGDVTSTAALEALTQITGVDREVRRAVPLIDDFRISSGYSLRSGRTEPQISVGKRIADRVRLSATTGVGAGDARDFRALVDVQLDDTTGVQCSYDNFTQGSATSFGNVGCDLRWRLEFE
ncbi:translocation/assembly module TamB domain-containing protein [Sandaracinus amylolyticus]|uniref:translocation/assembly module TamB domain-containing protein n=1 Tax=Sandaracinus amylolyticus TaxID=927083 RepID=UPI001F46288C|nr:translocation/assembly module TamB domain-containing protein [Sandaracinus amylolyticus]UJR78565.1 Hypothetical protein I5071_5950 [Sandaracinus amylolyticus]